MRTLTTLTTPGRTLKRISALGLASVAALSLAACGGSGSVKKSSSSSTEGSSGSQSSSQAATPTTSQSFDPAAGPVLDPNTLPKSCNGLVTDADIQLGLGQPLTGGDFFTTFKPDPGAKQTGRVKCQYGVVLDNAGKIQSDEMEVQLATYADAASAQSRAASTVAHMAATGAQYAQVSVDGHPATYVVENGKDAVLVMYDGNRTFLITVQAALAKDDQAKTLALKLGSALYKHTTPAAATAPSSGSSGSGSASGTPSGSPLAPGSSVPSGSASSSAAPSSAASS